MKIDTLVRSLGILNLVRSKQERGSSKQEQSNKEGSERQAQSDSDSQDPSSEQTFSEVLELAKQSHETPPRQLGEAVETFRSEVNKQANGLDVCMEGAGPGLKVILKDDRGSVVRSFTGEEFLKLRNAAYQEGRQSGKILDRKL